MTNSSVNPVIKPPKTERIPEAKLSPVGEFKPVPLTPSEKARVAEWQHARNQYLKTWRDVNVSKYPEKTQDLLVDTLAVNG